MGNCTTWGGLLQRRDGICLEIVDLKPNSHIPRQTITIKQVTLKGLLPKNSSTTRQTITIK